MEQMLIDFERKAVLNPSVEAIDEMRLKGNLRSLFSLFRYYKKIGRRLSTLDLMTEAKAQYNARLNELRHFLIPYGLCIDRIGGQGGVHYYEIVALSKSTFFKERYEKLAHLAPVGFEFED